MAPLGSWPPWPRASKESCPVLVDSPFAKARTGARRFLPWTTEVKPSPFLKDDPSRASRTLQTSPKTGISSQTVISRVDLFKTESEESIFEFPLVSRANPSARQAALGAREPRFGPRLGHVAREPPDAAHRGALPRGTAARPQRPELPSGQTC